MTETASSAGVAAQPSYSAESLKKYADQVAPTWRVAHKPEGPGNFGPRIDATGPVA